MACCRWLLVLPWLLLPLLGQAPEPHPPPPALIGDGWERDTPTAAGFDAARLETLLARMLNGETNLHGVIVERHGRLVAERYRRGPDRTVYSLFARDRDFGPTVRHDTRSVGKSVLSLLLGIARQQGRLGNLAAPVLDFYPEYAELAAPERRAITLEHLLTMSSGFQWHEGGRGRDDEHRLYWKWTPTHYALSRPIAAPPGSTFTYNSGGTAVLADLLVRATGIPLRDFARRNLFEPLGISDWEWVGDLQGRPMAFTGLRLRPRDLAKLGRLVLDHGRWRGRQVVPEDWLAASLQPRLPTGFDGLQYGYQWWAGTLAWQGRQLTWNAAFGNGGQRLFLVPELDLTVVIAAGAYDDLAAARRVNGFCRDLAATVLK